VEPQNSNVHISTMRPADLPGVVTVHLNAFPGFFLSGLGRRFLSLFYSSVLEDASGMAFVARGADGIQGFVAGSIQPSGFYRRILSRRGYRFALAAIGPVMRNPGIIPRLLRSFLRTSEYRIPGAALLMSIAVSLAVQGKAIGHALFRAFLDECQRRQATCIYLTTDHLNNDRTNSFYLKMGFALSRTYATPEGRLMNEYRLELEQHAVQHIQSARST
jgi:GNAT superfamily N-acetyltransferase